MQQFWSDISARGRTRRPVLAVALTAVLLTLSGCLSRQTASLRSMEQIGETVAGVPEGHPLRSVALTSGGPDASLSYLAWVGDGADATVIVIDLGWGGAQGALRSGLSRLGAAPSDVGAVFLTHSHRDHIAAWPLVAHAPFYLGAEEVPLLVGTAAHGGWIPRMADRIRRPGLPRAGQVRPAAFAQDTAFVFGRDTVHAFTLPGHTAGSSAYLIHGVLFVGDGLSHDWRGRLRHARAGYSDDTGNASASVCRILTGDRALPMSRPHAVCTAHARCEPMSMALVERLCAPTG